MECPRCRAENSAGTRFCEDCGAPLGDLKCPTCGTPTKPGKRFCGSCGRSLTPERASRYDSPESYTPPHLAEKILTSKAALEGERKLVTVLFADLKGSMELLADRDPEDARKILDPVLELMMEAVHRYEGTVNQVMGDGIMALFGAPLAHEDHAVRASFAALRMQERVNQYGDEAQRVHGVPIQIRVGLNSGEVVVRAIGSDLRMDYTAVGQTTHLAARMEQMAKAGSILMTADTLRLAEGYVQVKAVGPVPLKGLTEPVEVYEVAGAGPVRTRIQASAARGLTPFVGRRAELEQLYQALRRAGAGRGQIIAGVGEPGVGKSRLFHEFTHSHRTQGWLLLETGSVSYGKATAYLPVIDLLKEFFHIEGRDDARKIREKVSGKLVTLDQMLLPALPAFLALLDVPVDDAPWQALDPPQRRQRTLEAIKRLLLRESHVQPLVLIFEDLHWIDSETQAVLDGLIESLPTARILLLVNYRSEYEHAWTNKTYYTQVRIDQLLPESAEEFVRALLSGAPELQPLRRLLIEWTDGNPFFLEESVRTLVETKALIGERGAYRLTQAVHSLQVPSTVQAVLAARIDRLQPEEKRLLQTAAVIGKDVPFALLQALAELTEPDLGRRLTHLQAAEFLYETSLFPDLEYTFKHALTHEVAYGSLVLERRRVLHARIVEAIERHYPNRLTEQIERLGHHALRGEMWGKAVTYLRQAGAKAFARSANREAVASFEQSLAALKHLPESRDTIEQAIDVRFDLRNSLLPLGELGRMFACLREAETLAEGQNDQRRLACVSSHMAHYFWFIGIPDRALEHGQRGLGIADGLGDFGLQVSTSFYLGLAYDAVGDYRRAADLFRRNISSLEGDLILERFGLPYLPSVLCRGFLAYCVAELGEFAEGISRGEEAIGIAESADHPFSLIFALRGIGHLYLRKGDTAKATSVLERALGLCRSANLRVMFPAVASALGSAYALCGRNAEAVPLLERAVEAAPSMGLAHDQAQRVGLLSEACLLAGRVEAAVELCGRALDLAREHKERGWEAWALRLLGEIASHRNPSAAAKAQDSYRHALALSDDLGMRPLVAHCHLGLGKLYRHAGRQHQAHEHVGAATAMYREMDMRFWLEKAEAALEGIC
jgi:class 3 adenylate cyclase/tetratricopeptide (TPR) repeat protein